MNKCLKIIIFIKNFENNLTNTIQKLAKKNNLEGFAQFDEGDIKITICGKKEDVDNFVDKTYKELEALNISSDDVEIEPFIKDKDYRGVFRIIE